MAPDGTVEFSSPKVVKILGWTNRELQGENIKLLMGERIASRHDEFLQRYQERAAEKEAEGCGLPTSNIVGSGRDVIARHKNGNDVRVFLTVVRLDRALKKAQDCLFVGFLVGVAEAVPGKACCMCSQGG